MTSTSRAGFMRWLATFLVALAVFVTDVPNWRFAPSDAVAQERRSFNPLRLFRRKARPQRRAAPRRAAPRRAAPRRAAPRRRATQRRATRRQAAPRRTTRRSTRRSAPRNTRRASPRRNTGRVVATTAPAAAAVAPVAKVENAETVLVIGDFLAGSLADGLEATFAESPGVRIVDAANGASGLVRDDFYDWSEAIPALIERHDPIVVVMQIGANDRQPIREEGGRLAPGSPEWTEAYKARIAEAIDLIQDTNTPFVWVGTPAFSSRALTADMVTFNGYYEAAVTAANGRFIDVWDGFVDRNGAYMRSGPDVNGEVVRLRGSDGINLTRAGRRKMAFFAEKAIRDVLGSMASPAIGSITPEGLPPLGEDLLEAPLQPSVSPPIALNDPVLDGGSALLGGAEAVPEAITGPQVNPGLVIPVEEGVPTGRADNFAWPQG